MTLTLALIVWLINNLGIPTYLYFMIFWLMAEERAIAIREGQWLWCTACSEQEL